MADLKWETDPASRRFAIEGMISGEGELGPVAAVVPASSTITLDLGGLRAFTSSGVQAWLRFLHRLRDKGCRLRFERCSPAVVKQTMAIYDFLAGGAVRSLLVPYVCPHCDNEAFEELVVTPGTPPAIAATRRCTCGAEMEFDDLLQPYREFLREAAQRALLPDDQR